MKYYARQIPPEYQESPIDVLGWDEVMYPGLVLTGNQDFHEHTTEVWDKLMDNWEDAHADSHVFLEYQEAKESDYDFDEDDWFINHESFREIIEDYLPPMPTRGPYTDEEISKWLEVLDDMNDAYEKSYEERGAICRALDLLTGKNWTWTELHGCCQGDWVLCYYDTDTWDREGIEYLEATYFNMGTEWIVHDGPDAPTSPEDIEGCSYYCVEYGDALKKELAGMIGCAPEELVMYEFNGFTRIAKYKEVE